MLMVFGVRFAQAPAVQAAVKSCTNSTPVAQRPVLYPGDSGSCVKVAQGLLNTKGGYSLPVTGYYGSLTTSAVKSYQARNGIVQTGNVGSLTWAKLLGIWDIHAGPTHRSVILSFDDCPKSYSSFKATVDKGQAIHVTLLFAVTGQCLAGNTFSASYARAHGHMVIGHSISHPDLTTLSNAGIAAQIDPVSKASGVMRAPYGAIDSRVVSILKAHGIRVWLWTVDTNDWRGLSSVDIVRYVLANAKGNDVVLMHMQWNGFTPTALVPMVAGLRAQGKTVCGAYAKGTAPTWVPTTLPC